MLKHAALSIVIVLILTASIYAAANMSDPNVFFAPHPRDSMLNENQRLWIKYSDTILRDVFPKTDFSALSDSAKQEIELKWVADLNLPRRYKNDAINGLSLHKSKAAVDGLLSIACDVNTGDNQPRWMAVRALGMLDDISVVPYMAHLVYHYNLNARQWAQVSLVRLTGQNFGSDWRAWGRWWNSQGGNPPFEDKFIPWHPDANWADPAKQIQKDQELFDKLKMLEQIIELKGNLSSIVIDEGRGFNLFQVGQTTCSPFYAR